MTPTLYTIGHGRRTWEEFLALIDASQISLVVDGRWRPYSRWAPWANRKRLEAALGDRYLYDGARLGNPAHFGALPIPESDYRAAIDARAPRARRRARRDHVLRDET